MKSVGCGMQRQQPVSTWYQPHLSHCHLSDVNLLLSTLSEGAETLILLLEADPCGTISAASDDLTPQSLIEQARNTTLPGTLHVLI